MVNLIKFLCIVGTSGMSYYLAQKAGFDPIKSLQFVVFFAAMLGVHGGCCN